MTLSLPGARRWALALLAAGAAACAPGRYAVRAPEPSGLKSERSTGVAPGRLSVIDARRADDKVFSAGRLTADLTLGDAPIEPIGFLAEQLTRELASRGLPAAATAGDGGAPRLHVRTFRILNHRASGFSPFVTLTFLGADLETPAGPRRLGVFVKRGKVPVWGFDEVIEPIFTQPLSLAVKELASKVAGALYGARASDATVAALVARVGAARTDQTYLDVYALGFSNNRAAIPRLVELTRDQDEYVRLAALSSLGTLGAVEQLGLLQATYQDPKAIWQDRAMAAKAIGDLGTEEARAFLEAERRRLDGAPDDTGTRWMKQVLSLYQP